AAARGRSRAPCEPLLPGCDAVAFADGEALERALALRDAALFLVEPAQVEGGLRFAPPAFLQKARALCTKYGTLLALDEVQTGIGRTGSLFAFQQAQMAPDLLVLGKSLGGSIAPAAVTMATRAVQKSAYGPTRRFDLHGSTFAGNAFASAAGLETLQIVHDERLAERSRDNGAAMLAGLRERLAGHPLVADVRGLGLLIAID